MFLNDRKVRILEAIINDYIATGEPIGSRTIAKKYDLGISSATIRNEMSDLEELGLIVQPHTSAGRVPSDKGYRLYVDRLMNCRELTGEEIKLLQTIVSSNINHIDYLMQETAKALSMLTNYTTVVSEPKTKNLVGIKHVQLVPIDERSIVVVTVTDSKAIKNSVVNVGKVPDADELNKISAELNSIINSPDKLTLYAEKSPYSDMVSKVIESVNKCMNEENVRFYTSGVNNMLDFPEFSNIEKAKGLFKAFEEKEILINVLGDTEDSDSAIQISIGVENDIEQLKDCSIIKAKYNIGDAEGSIGIIGPTRMNYSQTVSVLNGIVKNINQIIKALSGG